MNARHAGHVDDQATIKRKRTAMNRKKDAMNNLIGRIHHVLDSLPSQFSSHDLIKELRHRFQDDYNAAIDAYESSENRPQAVHSGIGRYLLQQKESVLFVDKIYSANLSGNKTRIARWDKSIVA
jgi:hypothetical protein